MKLSSHRFAVSNYALAETLNSGQAFRWREGPDGWEGVIDGRWVLLSERPGEILCRAMAPVRDWTWVEDYLQLHVNLERVLAIFPSDPHMRMAVETCRGLRLLRQDPWECLASFILSSTKQITQIKQVVESLCTCFGRAIPVPEGSLPAYGFPGPDELARTSEQELRKCKMGFRAKYLLPAAQAVASGSLDLEELRKLELGEARQRLVKLAGVGPKIANCVLLFAYGFCRAFPLDVWVLRALRELYFPGENPSMKQLEQFSDTYFGEESGYAQQYLFHAVRTGRISLDAGRTRKKGR